MFPQSWGIYIEWIIKRPCLILLYFTSIFSRFLFKLSFQYLDHNYLWKTQTKSEGRKIMKPREQGYLPFIRLMGSSKRARGDNGSILTKRPHLNLVQHKGHPNMPQEYTFLILHLFGDSPLSSLLLPVSLCKKIQNTRVNVLNRKTNSNRLLSWKEINFWSFQKIHIPAFTNLHG